MDDKKWRALPVPLRCFHLPPGVIAGVAGSPAGHAWQPYAMQCKWQLAKHRGDLQSIWLRTFIIIGIVAHGFALHAWPHWDG